MSDRFGIDMPATVTFDHPTVEALAAFITARVAPEEISSSAVSQPDASRVAASASVPLIKQQLQEAVEEVLGFSVAGDQPLMEAGLDSIGESAKPLSQKSPTCKHTLLPNRA